MVRAIREECAVAAAAVLGPYAPETGGATAVVYGLLAAQTNRGDLSTGIARYDGRANLLIEQKKGLGTPYEVFGKPRSEELAGFLRWGHGEAAIGHNRYATSGENLDDRAQLANAQPFLRTHSRRCKEFAFAFNGNLPNSGQIRATLIGESGNYHFKTGTDTEVIQILMAQQLRRFHRPLTDGEYVQLWAGLFSRMDGACNLVYLDANGTLVFSRDPHGFRPLSWGRAGPLVACASESSALRQVGLQDIQDVGPGEMVIVDRTGPRVRRYGPVGGCVSRCVFEMIYFMKSSSAFDGISVHRTREAIGEELAREETLPMGDEVVVAPVPGTGIPLRTGYVNALIRGGQRVTLADPLIQESMSRSFIADFVREDRLARIRRKFDLTPGYLEGKDVVLLDDSVVRGNTSRQLVSYVKEVGGARSVHLRIGAPPNRHPCHYGINMPTREELVASGRNVEGIRNEIGADSIQYLTEEALLRAIGRASGRLGTAGYCLGCFTGEYPTRWGRLLSGSVAEVPPAGEEHGDPGPIDRVDDGGVILRPTGL